MFEWCSVGMGWGDCCEVGNGMDGYVINVHRFFEYDCLEIWPV